jgi:LysR family transcriptional regulator, mexEF-oprN operon transcriptional activator
MVKLIEMNDSFNEIDFRGLDLNVLLTFVALMRERSVTKAALRMYLGSSAISMALKRLRELFDDPLLVRTREGMVPTPKALALYARIERSLGDIHNTVFQPATFDPRQLLRSFRFGAPDDLEMVVVPELLARLRNQAPGVRLIVRPSDFRHVLGSLDQSDIDLALTALPDQLESWHQHEVLYQDHFVCVTDPKQVGIKRAITMKQYIATPHVLLSPRGELISALDDRLKALGQQRNVVAAVAHFPLMPFVLRSSACLTNMPAVAARFFECEYRLYVSKLPFESPQFDVALIWHAKSSHDPALNWLKDLVKQVVASALNREQPKSCG